MSAFWNWLKGLFSAPTAPTVPAPSPVPTPVAAPAPVAAPVVSETPWINWMKANLGQPMVTGKKASAFEIEVFSHTSDDEVEKSGIEASGCAATACAALELTGYKSPHSAAALSFATYGEDCVLKPGAVVVFKWADGGHHVTFCESVNSDGTFQGIGGNQGSPASLCVERFATNYAIACRWPVKSG